MSDVVIRVEGVGKRYRIGGQQGPYKTFRETLVQTVRAPLQRFAQRHSEHNTFWALNDVSFEVKRGEVLGVIGRNGAGKSTLLKILSRITEPTTGAIYLKGRVGALLEVGTGFHPELTGRENIYLSGTILGMKRAEISRKFDEIVAFSGVEQFIDTPVKRYSSGMGLRLGFAVAAHLEPEILVVDEVLAVGDAEFQKKCLGKMSQVAGEGRTVLFVSHSMAAVESLCNRGLVLHNGTIKLDGDVEDAINTYMNGLYGSTEIPLESRQDRTGDGSFHFSHFSIEDAQGSKGVVARSGDDVYFVLHYVAERPIPLESISVAITVHTSSGQRICTFYSGFSGDSFLGTSKGGVFRCFVPKLPLAAGNYKAELWSAAGLNPIDWIKEAASFDVIEGDFFGTGKAPNPSIHGHAIINHTWQHFAVENNLAR